VAPLRERSHLARRFADNEFATIVELLPPKGFVADDVLEQARSLAARGVDAVQISEGPRGARLSALALAALVQQRTAVEPILQYSCRDRSLLGMESDLLGAHAMGVRNLLVVTGHVQQAGDYADATAVFEVDSIGLTNVVHRLNEGLDIGGQSIGAPSAFVVGVHLNPGAEDLDHELRRFEYKLEAGADFAVTGPVFDLGTFERLYRRVEQFRVPIVLGLWPFDSALNAEFMANEVPGVRVPDEIIERMRRAPGAEAAAAEGVTIATELGAQLRHVVHGIHIAAPGGRVDAALSVLDGVRVTR
jgi:homocysteine S-methyltransferase